MQCDENDIIDYLKGWPGSFISGKEIARKAGGKQLYEDDRGWAIPILAQLVQRGIIESDHLGCFRLKVEARKKKRQPRHISPQILKILESSGKRFDEVTADEVAEDPPVTAYPKGASTPAVVPALAPAAWKPAT